MLPRTEGASPSVAAPAKSSYQRSSAKKPRLHGHQCSYAGKSLSRLVSEQKGLSTATIAERPREQGQDHPNHQRRAEQGADRHCRPVKCTQIQREIYGERPCPMLRTNRVAKSSRVERTPSSVIVRLERRVTALQRWKRAVVPEIWPPTYPLSSASAYPVERVSRIQAANTDCHSATTGGGSDIRVRFAVSGGARIAS